MVRIMPNQTRRGAAYAESPVLGLALAARQGQNLSRHSAASPTVHILAEGDRTAWLTMQSATNLASSTSPSRLKPSRQLDGKRRFECRVQVRVLVHEVLEFRFGPGNVARRLDRHGIGRCRLFRHVADAAKEMSELEFADVAAVDLGTDLARVDHHEAVQRLVALDEALACLGVFPGCQLE